MALQDYEKLCMVGMGALDPLSAKYEGALDPNNKPGEFLQPEIIPGIHLRWSSKQDDGLPWYGYYLLRRVHIPPCGSPGHLPPRLVTWGDDYLSSGVLSGTPVEDDFVQVSTSTSLTLALKADGPLVSWPSSRGFISPTLDPEKYGTPQLGKRPTGSIVAWGQDQPPMNCISGVPSGNDFLEVCAGHLFCAALRYPGEIVTWGLDEWGLISDVPTGIHTQVSVGIAHALALGPAGAISAWGLDYPPYQIADPNLTQNWSPDQFLGSVNEAPTDDGYFQVEAGSGYSFALKKDPNWIPISNQGTQRPRGSIVYWGSGYINNYPHALPPSHRLISDVPQGNDFVQISTSNGLTIALRIDGSVVWWKHGTAINTNYNPTGECPLTSTDAPSTPLLGSPVESDFVQVTALHSNTCMGLRANGEIVVWGVHVDTYAMGTDKPTETDFIAIDTGQGWGTSHTAAIAEGTDCVQPTCVFADIQSYPALDTMSLPKGTFSSDQPLKALEQFAPSTRPELSLEGRDWLTFENLDSDVPIRKYILQLGGHKAPKPPTAPDGPGSAAERKSRRDMDTIEFAAKARPTRPDSLFIDGLLMTMAWPGRRPIDERRDSSMKLARNPDGTLTDPSYESLCRNSGSGPAEIEIASSLDSKVANKKDLQRKQKIAESLLKMRDDLGTSKAKEGKDTNRKDRLERDGLWSAVAEHGIDCGAEMRITLPRQVDEVEIEVFVPDSVAVIAYNDSGQMVGMQTLDPPTSKKKKVKSSMRLIRIFGANLKFIHILPNVLGVIVYNVVYPSPLTTQTGPRIVIQGMMDGSVVVEKAVHVTPNQIISTSIEADCMDSVRIGSGPASLVELCYLKVAQNASKGWRPVQVEEANIYPSNHPSPMAPNSTPFGQPFYLPITDPDYTNPAGSQTNSMISASIANPRIDYGDPFGSKAVFQSTGGSVWNKEHKSNKHLKNHHHFDEIHSSLAALVVGGQNSGIAMKDRDLYTGTGGTYPLADIANVKALDMVMLSAINPAYAQMYGLYWVDQNAKKGMAYDYMIVTDRQNSFDNDVYKVMQWLDGVDPFNTGFLGKPEPEDAYIVFNKRRETPTALEAPEAVKAIALPDTYMPVGATAPLHAASLRWQKGPDDNGFLPLDSIMFHVWRADWLAPEIPEGPQQPIAMVDHGLSTKVRVCNDPSCGAMFTPLATQCGAVKDPAGNICTSTTYHWQSMPKGIPLDYNPDNAPSRPACMPPLPGWQMFHTDHHLPDGWYGFRVSGVDIFGRHSDLSEPARWWQWDPEPDPLPWYYELGQGSKKIHDHAVRLIDVTPPPPPFGTEAWAIDLDDPHLVVDTEHTTWEGTLLAGEEAGSPEPLIGLRVRWKWTPGHDETAPDTKEFRIYYNSSQHGNQTPPLDAQGNPSGTGDFGSGGPEVDPADPSEWESRIYVIKKDDTTAYDDIVTCDRGIHTDQASCHGHDHSDGENYAASVAANSPKPELNHWANTKTLRLYDVILPRDTDKVGNPLQGCDISSLSQAQADRLRRGLNLRDKDPIPTGMVNTIHPNTGQAIPSLRTDAINTPIAHGWVSVSAVDDRDWPDQYFDDYCIDPLVGNRRGNEGAVAPPIPVLRVHRKPPDPPSLPEYDDDVWATKANYQSESFWTFRWEYADLKAYVFRALDQSLFMQDYDARDIGWWDDKATVPAIVPVDDLLDTDPMFDELDPDGLWDRADVADNINDLQTAVDNTPTLKEAIEHPDGYGSLTATQVRVLASMRHTQDAFTQLTINPVDEADSRRPDDGDGYTADAALRAHTDTLDGKARNRYFYRVASIDEANNIGEMSLASPRVNLHQVVPPKPPMITKILGGDKEITIKWSSNRSPNLQGYLLYRADNEEDTRDIRLMEQITRVDDATNIDPDPSLRPDEVVYADSVEGHVQYYYVVFSYDNLVANSPEECNVSVPSRLVSAQAFDLSPPNPPTNLTAEWVKVDSNNQTHAWSQTVSPFTPAIQVDWTATDPQFSFRVRRMGSDGFWSTAAQWEADSAYILDTDVDPLSAYEYKVDVKNLIGTGAESDNCAIQAAGP